MSLIDVAGLAKAEISRQLRRDLYKDDPVLWVEEYLGQQLWSKQKEILYSIRDNRNTAVAAGHSVGKSHVAAIAVAWWVDTHPLDKIFIATMAPSTSQLGIIWDSVRRIYALSHQRYIDKIVDHPLPGYITGDHKWKAPDGTVIGEGRSPKTETVSTSFQGRHADFLFAIGDEAVGLSQEHLDALGNIATGPSNRQLLLANPTNPGSAMADIWHKELSTWNRMHISVYDSPAVTNEEGFDITPDMSLSGWDYIEEMTERWGEHHPIVTARVHGQWAMDADSLVFAPEEIASAVDTVVVPYDDEFPQHGWDISADGPDFTVGYEMKKGLVWETDEKGKPIRETNLEGFQIRRVDKWNKTPLVTLNPDKESTASKIHEKAVERVIRTAIIDTDGIGISVVNGIASITPDYSVIEFRGNGAPSEKNRVSYENIRAEMFFLLRDDMILGRLDIDPKDEELVNELSGIQYEETPRGKLKIESKREMKSRGMKSPDHADACMYSRFPVEILTEGLGSLPAGAEVELDPWDFVEDEMEWGAPGVVM